jgi:hypothetical protein
MSEYNLVDVILSGYKATRLKNEAKVDLEIKFKGQKFPSSFLN